MGSFIDIFLILIFAYLCYKLFIISFKKNKRKKLYRSVSVFFLFHIIIFPIIYVLIINNNPESVEINGRIIVSEKNIKLSEFNNFYDTDIQYQKEVISRIIKENKEKTNNLTVDSITNKKLLFLNSNIISIHSSQTIPGPNAEKLGHIAFEVFIFDKKGNYLFDFIAADKNNKITSVLSNYISELSSKENKKKSRT